MGRRYSKRILWTFLLFIAVIFGYIQINAINKNIEEYEEAGADIEYSNYIEMIKDSFIIDEKVEFIIDNIEKYPKDVLDLLVNNNETLEFVAGYLTIGNSNQQIALSKPKNGEIPLYQQWDSRWGYGNYGNNIIAINGCGPTCLSMVVVGLLKDTKWNPMKVAEYSYNNGYYDANAGTLWDLMSSGAEDLGLQSTELGSTLGEIVDHLKKGHPIIASMSPGDFTTLGHYIVISDINDNKEVKVNDPNSLERSEKMWDLETIINQAKNLWAFSKL